jgi:hypothetical protein
MTDAETIAVLAILPELTLGNVGQAFCKLIASLQDSLTMQVLLGTSDGWRQLSPLVSCLASSEPQVHPQNWLSTLLPSAGPLATFLPFVLLLSLPQAGPQPVLAEAANGDDASADAARETAPTLLSLLKQALEDGLAASVLTLTKASLLDMSQAAVEAVTAGSSHGYDAEPGQKRLCTSAAQPCCRSSAAEAVLQKGEPGPAQTALIAVLAALTQNRAAVGTCFKLEPRWYGGALPTGQLVGMPMMRGADTALR